MSIKSCVCVQRTICGEEGEAAQEEKIVIPLSPRNFSGVTE